MRVRVSYAVDVPDGYRRAIRRYFGRDGLATRAEVKTWLELHGQSKDDDLSSLYGEDEEQNRDLEQARQTHRVHRCLT